MSFSAELKILDEPEIGSHIIQQKKEKMVACFLQQISFFANTTRVIL